VRIGLIIGSFTSGGGGAERYAQGLIRELRARGHEVHVVTRRWDEAAAGQGVVLHPVPVIRWPPFLRLLSFVLNCRRIVPTIGCDLVLSLERALRQDIHRAGGGCHREWLIQRRRYGASWRRRLDRFNPLHRVLLWVERQTFRPENTRAIIANSHRGKEEIVRHYGFPADRIHVIHNGTDCDRFRPPAAKPCRNETVLLLVGSGFERKGVAFAIRALAHLPEAVRLEVVGKGNPRPYKRLAWALGVNHRIRFLGPTACMEAVYGSADILVHPAIYEPFSNACLEAMACGLPVVTSRINGASEIISPGYNGAVVEDPADSVALAHAIEPFLDPKVRSPAAVAARQTAASLPMALNVQRTLALMERLVHRSSE